MTRNKMAVFVAILAQVGSFSCARSAEDKLQQGGSYLLTLSVSDRVAVDTQWTRLFGVPSDSVTLTLYVDSVRTDTIMGRSSGDLKNIGLPGGYLGPWPTTFRATIFQDSLEIVLDPLITDAGIVLRGVNRLPTQGKWTSEGTFRSGNFWLRSSTN